MTFAWVERRFWNGAQQEEVMVVQGTDENKMVTFPRQRAFKEFPIKLLKRAATRQSNIFIYLYFAYFN